jgi:peptidoglycan hydrolase-like protein with peptidoglycan-binding domain
LGAIGRLAEATRDRLREPGKLPNPQPAPQQPASQQPVSQQPDSQHSGSLQAAPESTAPPGSPDFMRILRKILTIGMEGEDVADIQRKLKTLGIYKGEPTGSFDAQTESAVKTFQKSVAIEINGRVGEFTLGKLNDAVAVYGPGSQGPGVEALQKHLRALRYLKADATGLFDEATEKAVRDFQLDRHLEVSGKAGPTTRQFIAEAMVEQAAVDVKLAKHRELLARAIAAEARGEPFEAKVGIAVTILNYARIHDRNLPRLIRSSYLSSNFDGNRRFYTMPAMKISNWDECLAAADVALTQGSRIGSRSHFVDDSIGPPPWVDSNSGLKIGRMVFYRGKTS